MQLRDYNVRGALECFSSCEGLIRKSYYESREIEEDDGQSQHPSQDPGVESGVRRKTPERTVVLPPPPQISCSEL
ncbi:hypothetical protein TNCV_1166481 [Trichonephila clavipes]|uniref:Uncharacterized protein n=1 Tax=Trichonephila clavipes TaxID=2585209 RepID=A0A8X6VT83_TRICX|nr:hypothetical protein TNCV_1166481 [Trichonephila clavipes]